MKETSEVSYPNQPLTSPEQQSVPSRGKTIDELCGQPAGAFKKFIKEQEEANTHVSSTGLDKAIDRIDNDTFFTRLEDVCQFKQDIKTLLTAAKKYRELQQHSHSKDELIEKLVETVEYCGSHNHSETGKCILCHKVDEARSLAHAQGYGKERTET